MNLKPKELEYLSAWAREEQAADPYTPPHTDCKPRIKSAG